ncbi:MAG: C-GCAxxG-C-C family protein [Candidatus Aminicenantes bacterium]|nr:C-GCAxxG-C-C family protein [Candidatus Aminicenantes bacterium]
MNAGKNDAKRVFLKKGTCSQTLCFLLDREFGHLQANEERAADPLAGGLLQGGQQCGMLWGAALAAGAESFRRHADRDQAIAAAIIAAQHLVESFEKRAKSVNCRDITGCDFSSKFGLAKALLLGRFVRCFKLAGRWAPEAIQSAKEGLSRQQTDSPPMPISCASEVAKKIGASDEEMAMVAGFAGGIGLSGNGCGALAAAIWMTTLELVRKKNWKYSLSDPLAGEIIKKFRAATGSEMECRKITGKRFKTLNEHAEFLKNGGCDKLIDLLARS